MSYKNFLFDKAFWILVWPTLRGCIIYTATSLILLLILAVVSRSFPLSIQALQATTPRIIRWSVFLTILFNLVVLLITFGVMAQYLSEPPLKMEGFRISLKEIQDKNKRLRRTTPEDIAPFIFLIFVISGLFNAYILEGSSSKALQPEVTFVLPFTIGLSVASWFRILVLIGFLHLKYILQRRHHSL